MTYMGSVLVYGRGKAVVVATGMDTEMGKIANAISLAEESKTPLEIKLEQFSRVLTKLAIALAVAAIPEGLVAVMTIVLSIGVTNMSKKHAIIRKMNAVETLGCTQIICSDKTGTLTQNVMTVVDHYAEDEKVLATAMTLCTNAEVVEGGKSNGDPDEILKKCAFALVSGQVVPMTEAILEKAAEENTRMGNKALRVFAVATKEYTQAPEEYTSTDLEYDMVFIGLTGMIDPVRPEVKDAIVECRHAGITPIMITGDHINTAKVIARELGILTDDSQAMMGADIEKYSDEEFEKIVENIFVYARVQPEHKTRIVNAWKNKGYVTAMTGDGVNDAPSIKSADIGVGMGITGTDVTKNVADMVLTDDNFALYLAMVGSLLLTTAVVEIDFLSNLFGFAQLDLKAYLISLGLAFLIIPIVEIVKAFQRARAKH